MQNKNNLLTIFNFSLSFHDSTKPILFRFILLLLSFHDRSRSPQFGHLHGFFTARGPKWRQFCDAAKSKLACFRTAFVRRSPTMKPVTRERASIVTGIINGPSLFSLIRASRRPCHASRASFVEKTIYNRLLSPRFRAFLITSSLIDTSLPLYIHQASLCLHSLSYTHISACTNLPPPLLPSFTPLYSPFSPPFLSLSLSLFSSFDH